MFQAAAIILAGGKNSRMNGADKSQLLINRRTLIERTLEKLQSWFPQVLIVSNPLRRYDYPGVEQIIDERENCGPLMGLYCGLKASAHPLNLLLACDMPHLNETLVRLLIDAADDFDVTVPVVNNFYEPLLAVYNKNVLPAVQLCLSNHQYKLTAIYQFVKVREITQSRLAAVDPQLLSFLNINTQHDLNQARQILDSTPAR